MAKSLQKIEAQRLRRKGRSVKEVAEYLKVSKSTASRWCKDVTLSARQKEFLVSKMVLGGHLGRIRGAETNRKKKEKRVAGIEEEVRHNLRTFPAEAFLISGAMLYWGEGRKKDNFSFSNSDPEMIVYIFNWLIKAMMVPREDISVRILINEMHRPRTKKVLQFWAGLLKLPPHQFRKTTFIRVTSKKIYANYNEYYGVAVFRVKNGSGLLYRINAIIKSVKEFAGVAQLVVAWDS